MRSQLITLEEVRQQIETESDQETYIRERQALHLESSFPIYLFGAGRLGSFVLEWLYTQGINALAFVDNNDTLWGQERDGIPILSPCEMDKDAQYIVTAYNTWGIRRQLMREGIKRIVPYHHVFWRDTEWFRQRNLRDHGMQHRIDCPSDIRREWGDIEKCYGIWSSEQSRSEFCEQMLWRFTLDDSVCTQPEDVKDIYFPNLFNLSYEEVFIDCGAYDGDTITEFAHRVGSRFKQIVAFEPDPVNLGKLKELKDYRLIVLPYALSHCNGKRLFVVRGDATSRLAVNEDGLQVQCVTLDSMNLNPTFIKMDIEGAELQAISGARNTIMGHRPIIAACVYHQGSHIWEIPRMLKSMMPDYRLFLRRYAEECRESVCYAIPPERLR